MCIWVPKLILTHILKLIRSDLRAPNQESTLQLCYLNPHQRLGHQHKGCQTSFSKKWVELQKYDSQEDDADPTAPAWHKDRKWAKPAAEQPCASDTLISARPSGLVPTPHPHPLPTGHRGLGARSATNLTPGLFPSGLFRQVLCRDVANLTRNR